MDKLTIQDLIKYSNGSKKDIYVTQEMFNYLVCQGLVCINNKTPMVLGMNIHIVPKLSDERLSHKSDFL